MEDLRFLQLWDLYHPLLTPLQQEITNLYFNCDLSLSEIAEQKGCSRQSVSDCLQKCRKQLEAFEEKLGFSRISSELSAKLMRLTGEIGQFAHKLPNPFQDELLTLLARDGDDPTKEQNKS